MFRHVPSKLFPGAEKNGAEQGGPDGCPGPRGGICARSGRKHPGVAGESFPGVGIPREEFLRRGQHVVNVDRLWNRLDVLMDAVTGSDERHAAASGIDPSLQIGLLVADHEGFGKVDVELLRRLEKESGLGYGFSLQQNCCV